MVALRAAFIYARISAPAWLGISVFLATGNGWLTAAAQVLSLFIAATVGLPRR